MGEYIPQAPINDEAKQHNKELPGMGGVFNYVNLHAYHYAGNNPVKLTDPDGNYDRNAAVAYAHKWSTSRNSEYKAYTRGDCANFVSQALSAGGIRSTETWHSNRFIKVLNQYNPSTSGFDYDVGPAWRLVNEFFSFLSNPDNGYINGDVITISSAKEMQEAVISSGVQIGDVIFFSGKNGDNPHHAGIITKIEDGVIFYSAHTVNRNDMELTGFLEKEKVVIIKIKDDAL
jgi:hypothetical protein